jgi:PEP-CTERM motif
MNISMIVARPLAVLALATIVTAVQAQYTGAPYFSTPPTTQLSTVNSGSTFLTLSTTPADITVAGQFAVNLPSTPVSGTLLRWVVDRDMVPGVLYPSFMTTSALDGFSLPPSGVFGATGGILRTFITDKNIPNSVIGGSMSYIPISLTAGAATWNMLSASSAAFTLFTGTNYALRQVFDLDGVYLSGAGGTWIVDVPALSGLAPVPEPATYALFACGLFAVGLARCRRSSANNHHS